MKVEKICILGGTGFVGGHLIRALTQNGYQIRILTRYPHRHRELVAREVDVRAANIYDAAVLREQFAGMDAVVNLIGILNESGSDGSGFRRAHVELPRLVIVACQATGVARLLHMSALKAGDPAALSHYLRTKGEGENLVHAAAGPNFAVTSFRPSVIFGPGDGFLNHFAQLLGLLPFMPLPCSDAQFAPVYVGDVVAAITQALNDPASYGNRYDLCGPKVYTLRQIVEYIAQLLRLSRFIVPLNPKFSQLQARVMEYIPGKPLSLDNYLSLQISSTCPPGHIPPFALVPTPLEAIAPYYIGDHGHRNRYRQFREATQR